MSNSTIKFKTSIRFVFAPPYTKYSTKVPLRVNRIYSEFKRAYNSNYSVHGKGYNQVVGLVRKWIYEYVPKRSGQLQQYLINSIGTLLSSTTTQYNLDFFFNSPPEILRPKVIINPKHSPPRTGYAKQDLVKVTDPKILANVHLIKATEKGFLYYLDDPSAISPWMDALRSTIINILVENVKTFFESITIEYYLEAI